MLLTSLRRLLTAKLRSRLPQPCRRDRRRIRLSLDALEDRIVPTTITVGAGDTAGLITAINTANTDSANGIADTINLTANSTYSFSAANNTTNGPNALPVINVTNANIIINGGTGATITRASGSPNFRLFDANLTTGATLTLQDLTVSEGRAVGQAAGQSGQGGGLYASGGTVNLTNVYFTNNAASGAAGAAGSAGGNAQGGGIYAVGANLTLSGGSVSANALDAGAGGNGAAGTAAHLTGYAGGAGGNAEGGGIYSQGGSLTLTNSVSINNNDSTNSGGHEAGGAGGAGYSGGGAGGAGGAGGNAEGAGVYASQTTVTIENGATITNGTVESGDGGQGGVGVTAGNGGSGGSGGLAAGGGVYADGGSVVVSGATTQINVDTALAGNGGAGGAGGAAGNGGTGGAGGEADGGGLYVLNAPATVTAGTSIYTIPASHTITTEPGINNNSVLSGVGGNGGNGVAGGSGGAGGAAQGGGVFASGSGSAIALGDATHAANVNFNTINGVTHGNGGSGGSSVSGLAGTGGAGGQGTGGGMTVLGDTLNLQNTTLWGNTVHAGAGGSSGSGAISAASGVGGNVQGGGLFVSGSSNTLVLNSNVSENEAFAGNGQPGGNAQGGGLSAVSSTVQVINSTFAVNLLDAATAATTGLAGGQNNQGGGLYSANGTLTLVNDTVAWNDIVAYTNRGAAAAQGPGVYNGTANTLNLENTIIALNQYYSNFPGSGITPTPTFADLAGVAASQNDDNLIGDGIDSNLNVGGSEQLFVPALTTNSTAGAVPTQWQAPGNYGGLTYVLPLAWTSPALAKGDPSAVATIATAEGVANGSTTDERGLPRLLDGTIDIGATETQLLLTDSAPSSVQAGGTITYTLTVTNSEATAVNVTLSDVMPANTTYQANSASGTGWTITPPSSGNGNTLSATASIAANSSATLTFSVTVSSSAAANSTITNTATLAVTGNSAAGTRSASVGTLVTGSNTTNVTNEVGTYLSPVFRVGVNSYVQAGVFVNNSNSTFQGPVALVLVGLPSDVILLNASGTYDGSPYINLVPPGGTWQPGWWNLIVTILEFSAPSGADVTYTPEIIEGI